MEKSLLTSEFQICTAAYFAEKTKQAKGTDKMLVALEMSNYLREARKHGLSFKELKQQGFKFATV
ncbi:MAG: hypothetical protein ABIN67_12305 [Ferruginibacter sp.]